MEMGPGRSSPWRKETGCRSIGEGVGCGRGEHRLCEYMGTRGRLLCKADQEMKGTVGSWGGREQLGKGLVLIHMGSRGCLCDDMCLWTRYSFQRKSSDSSNWCRR